MSSIIQRVAIGAAVDQVWEVLADFGRVDQWAPTVRESHCPTEAQRGRGAKRILTTSTGEVTEEVVTDWNEGQSFTFEIPKGLASIITVLRETWSVRQLPQGTEVSVSMEYQLKGGVIPSLLNTLAVRRVLKKMLVHNLAGLKYHVETGERVTSKTANLPVTAVV